MTGPGAPVLDDEAAAFLRSHTWAILATGRADGSPQVSMVGYAVLDDGRIAISSKSYTAKWRNAQRQPRVALAVPDGRAHLVLYGTVECIEDDPARAGYTADVFGALSGSARPDPSTLVGFLDEQQRTVLLLTVDRAVLHH